MTGDDATGGPTWHIDARPLDHAEYAIDSHPRLSALIDRCTVQLEACPDDACRRAWRGVLDGLEEMLPIGVGEPVR